MSEEEINSQIAAHRAAIEALQRLKLTRAPDAPPTAPVDQGPPGVELSDLIEAGDAAAIARRSKVTIAAWCRENPINGEAGFAVKLGARWSVSKSRLLRHLASGSSD
ncbi:hypothetical protein [Bradyrhizobium sp. S3.9.1]|uniref:hypothetical protein n=1 Tax=Bradyrhizobium sp. S3.9.1 TaxID=3156431 RepID=UPI003399467C